MKILLINNNHYRKGGDSTVYLNMGRILSENGHEVSYLSMQNPLNEPCETSGFFIKNPQLNNKGTIYQLLNFWKYIYSRESLSQFKRLIKHKRPDIIHLHSIRGGITSPIILEAKRLSIPIIQTVHDYHYLCPINTMVDGNMKVCNKCANGNYWFCTLKKCEQNKAHYSLIQSMGAFYESRIVKLISNLEYLIFVSNFSKNLYCERFPEIENKCSTIYNFSVRRKITSNTSYANCYESYYLYFGRINQIKGIFTLVEAFKQIPSKKLIIIGDGPDRDRLENFVNSNGINNISLIRHKTWDELKPYIENSKFTILPSEWYENNPMSIIESYQFGKPVIGSNIGGIPEILSDNITGYLFESGDIGGLVNVLNKANDLTKAEYCNMCEESQKQSDAMFNQSIFYDKIMKVYKQFVHENAF